MQRPEGFDRAPEKPAARPAKNRIPERTSTRSTAPERAKRVGGRSGSAKRVDGSRRATPKRPQEDSAERDARRLAKRDASVAKGDARRAAVARRKYERAEVKRFTRRQRSRRIALTVTVSVVGLVVALVLVAIFSPILSLRTVVVDGTARVDASAVSAAVEEQLGTPLALVDYGRIDAALRELPVIRSYTTETIPPGTIAVHIIEREPVVSVAVPTGGFVFVDAAGVIVEQSNDRLPGMPLVTESGTQLPNPAFSAAVEVLLAMPEDLRVQVDTITATTRDDVLLTLAGVTQAVKWGSANDSATKAKLLEVLRSQFGGAPGTFDVSAISTGIFRPA